MESLTEDPAGEVTKEMWDAFFGGVSDKEFDSPALFKAFIVTMLHDTGAKAEQVQAAVQNPMARGGGNPMQRAMQGGGMPQHPALAGGGPPR